MYKKSQGLSINVIIIVAIALIVLVVLIAIFTGRLGSFVSGVKETTTCSSSCEAINFDGDKISRGETCDRGRILPGSYGDVNVEIGEKCCCTPKR